MSDLSPELLLDLARLISRYPPETWDKLAYLLDQPRFRKTIIYFFHQLSRVTREAHKGPKTSPSAELEVDLEVALFLGQIRAELNRRGTSEIRQIADRLEMRFPPSAKKKQLIAIILDRLSAMNAKELNQYQLKLFNRDLSRQSEEDYKRWAHLIVGKRSK